MAGVILAIFAILWFFGFIKIPFLHQQLFQILNHPISIYNILIFLLVIWIIEILPSPFRQIIMVVLLLWVLSILGIIGFAGMSQLILVGVILGLVVALLQ